MTPTADSCRIRGEITGIAEKDGHLFLRVSLTGGAIEIAARPGETFHTGDAVLLDGEIHLSSATHAPVCAHHSPCSDADFLS